MKKIFISSDHAGFKLKLSVKSYLQKKKFKFQDLGPLNSSKVDYPDFAHPLAEKISNNENLKGIIICGSGIGVSMSANKHKGVRSALCWNKETAKLSRSHNNANVLSLPARFLQKKEAIEIVEIFLNTDFEGGRHERRVDKIDKKNS